MIVDDVPGNLTVLRKMLTAHGHTVRPAISGDIALKAIESDKPDLILLDILMPNMDGYDVCKFIKSNDQTKDIPIIFISALNETGNIVRAFQAGGVDYITKPFQAEEVVARVRTHLSLRQAIRDKDASHMMLQTILESIENTIITIDDSFNIINCNKPLDTICQNVSGSRTTFSSRLKAGAGPCARVIRQTLETNKPVTEHRVTCNCYGGKEKALVLNTAPMNLGNSSQGGAVLVIRDITRLVQLEKNLLGQHSFHNIIGKNAKMQAIFALLDRIADLEVNILINGESGTGKELIAEAIHYKGTRASGPLIKVNCAALSENLLESELFGHIRGAFTGAVNDRIGRCQAAEGGTLFLDEIGDISLQFQAKLLRFLEYKEFERIGESETRKADVRIVAATHHDLAARVKEGKFRQDLYYRLKGVMIHIPPLYMRPDDIPLLTRHFISGFSKSLKKQVQDVSEPVLKLFMDYSWPGNVRELKNALYQACALCPGEIIQKKDLPQELVLTRVTQGRRTGSRHLQRNIQPGEPEKERIEAILRKTDWNKAKSARLLGISRATLYNKILKYHIQPVDNI